MPFHLWMVIILAIKDNSVCSKWWSAKLSFCNYKKSGLLSFGLLNFLSLNVISKYHRKIKDQRYDNLIVRLIVSIWSIDMMYVMEILFILFYLKYRRQNGKPDNPILIGNWSITIGYNKCGTIYIILFYLYQKGSIIQLTKFILMFSAWPKCNSFIVLSIKIEIYYIQWT